MKTQDIVLGSLGVATEPVAAPAQSVLHVLGVTDAPGASPRLFALAAVGGIVGYLVGRKYGHPVVGVLAGMNGGASVDRVIAGRYAVAAVFAAVGAGAATASVKWKAHPAAGYVLGAAGASALSVIALGPSAYT